MIECLLTPERGIYFRILRQPRSKHCFYCFQYVELGVLKKPHFALSKVASLGSNELGAYDAVVLHEDCLEDNEQFNIIYRDSHWVLISPNHSF